MAMLGSMLLSTSASLVGAFMPDYWSYLVLRFFVQSFFQDDDDEDDDGDDDDDDDDDDGDDEDDDDQVSHRSGGSRSFQ